MSEHTQQEQEVRAIYQRLDEELYGKRNAAILDKLIAEDFRHHAPMPTPQGREGYKQFIAGFWQAFPDAVSTTEDLLVSGNKAAARYVMRGTHQGEFMGIPATGKPVEVRGISIYQIDNGQITEEWVQPDVMGMMQQLGATG